MAKISAIAAGNAFLPGFIERFNARFAIAPVRPDDRHRPLNITPDRLRAILCHREQRHVGQQGDAPQALPLLDRRSAQAVIADKAYDTDAILAALAAAGILAVIPPRATRRQQRTTDWHLYRQRHKIENLFGFMKHYRRVFARFDKLAHRYLAFVQLVAACILLR